MHEMQECYINSETAWRQQKDGHLPRTGTCCCSVPQEGLELKDIMHQTDPKIQHCLTSIRYRGQQGGGEDITPVRELLLYA